MPCSGGADDFLLWEECTSVWEERSRHREEALVTDTVSAYVWQIFVSRTGLCSVSPLMGVINAGLTCGLHSKLKTKCGYEKPRPRLVPMNIDVPMYPNELASLQSEAPCSSLPITKKKSSPRASYCVAYWPPFRLCPSPLPPYQPQTQSRFDFVREVARPPSLF